MWFSMWLQVFVDGMEPVRKPLERMFEDSTSEKSVRVQSSTSLPYFNVKQDELKAYTVRWNLGNVAVAS